MAAEYRERVESTIGKQKEEQIRSEVAKNRIQRADGVDSLVISGSQEIYFDAWSGRAFLSTRELVDAAVNQINYQINQGFSASLSDFYDLLDIPRMEIGDQFGWNMDEQLEVIYSATLLDGRKAAVEMRYEVQPFINYNRIG